MNNTDKIIRFLAHDGRVSVICANTTNLTQEARKIHDLSPTVTVAFGRLITMTSIMGTQLKEEADSITVQIRGDGPIEGMVVVANNYPKVKGYVKNPLVDIPLNEQGKIDVGNAIGRSGFLNIIKDIGLKDPYIGIVPLVSGEIAEDFANYFATSEQKPTVVSLGVLVDKERVKSAGGFIVTLMPDATDEIITKIEQTVSDCEPISKMLEKGLSLYDIAKKVSGDEDIKVIKEGITPIYECDCNKRRIEKGIITIGKEDLEKIIQEDEKADISCNFCNKHYEFNKQELERLLDEIKK